MAQYFTAGGQNYSYDPNSTGNMGAQFGDVVTAYGGQEISPTMQFSGGTQQDMWGNPYGNDYWQDQYNQVNAVQPQSQQTFADQFGLTYGTDPNFQSTATNIGDMGQYAGNLAAVNQDLGTGWYKPGVTDANYIASQMYHPFGNGALTDPNQIAIQQAMTNDALQSSTGGTLSQGTQDTMLNQATTIGQNQAINDQANETSFGQELLDGLKVMSVPLMATGIGELLLPALGYGAGTFAGAGGELLGAGTAGSAIDMGGAAGMTLPEWQAAGGLASSGTGFGGMGTVGAGQLGVGGLSSFGGMEGLSGMTAGVGGADAGTMGTATGAAGSTPTSTNGLTDMIKQLQAAQGNMPPGSTTVLQKLLGALTGSGGTSTGTGGVPGGTFGAGGTNTNGGNVAGTSLFGAGGNINNLVNSFLAMNQTNKNSDFLKQMLAEGRTAADPYAPYRSADANLLQKSYNDPLSIFQGGGYQALDKQLQDTMMARDAASGNLFNTPERMAQREAGFMNYNKDLQKNLITSSGASGNPSAQATFIANMSPAIAMAGKEQNAAQGAGVTAGMGVLDQILGGTGTAGTSGSGTGGLDFSQIFKMFGGGSDPYSATNVGSTGNFDVPFPMDTSSADSGWMNDIAGMFA